MSLPSHITDNIKDILLSYMMKNLCANLHPEKKITIDKLYKILGEKFKIAGINFPNMSSGLVPTLMASSMKCKRMKKISKSSKEKGRRCSGICECDEEIPGSFDYCQTCRSLETIKKKIRKNINTINKVKPPLNPNSIHMEKPAQPKTVEFRVEKYIDPETKEEWFRNVDDGFIIKPILKEGNRKKYMAMGIIDKNTNKKRELTRKEKGIAAKKGLFVEEDI